MDAIVRPHVNHSVYEAVLMSRSPFVQSFRSRSGWKNRWNSCPFARVFFGKPVVLDLSAVDLSQSAIAHLIKSLEQRNIRILGIEGVDHLTRSMPPLLTGGRDCLSAQKNRRSPRLNQSQFRFCSTAQCALVSRSLARVT
jgi:hypothetical protein